MFQLFSQMIFPKFPSILELCLGAKPPKTPRGDGTGYWPNNKTVLQLLDFDNQMKTGKNIKLRLI